MGPLSYKWSVKDQMAASTCGGSLFRVMERENDTNHKLGKCASSNSKSKSRSALTVVHIYEIVLFLYFYIIFPKLVRKAMILNFTL